MKKIFLKILIPVFLVGTLSGCSNKVNDKTVINISILNSKQEMQVELEEALKEFSKENNNIKVKAVKYSQNNTHSNKLDSMYGSGNAPTISIIDPGYISKITDKLTDLSNEEWAKEMGNTISDIVKNKDDKIVAFPLSLEGMGLIYNKKVIEEAGIDVNSINTISSLEQAFKKIESIGKKGVVVTNEAWSLGDHFFPTAYAIQGENEKDSVEYLSQLKSGQAKLKDNSKVNGLLDTFDIMKKYNMYAENPLAPSYDRCTEALANGEVGFWYMGNWVSGSLNNLASDDVEFGFIPVPISNNSSDYGNSQIVIGVTQYIVIDKENNSEEQQEAAKLFLQWLINSEYGKDFLENKAGIISAANYEEVKSDDSLTNEILRYKKENLAMTFMTPYLPTTNADNIGVYLRKYLNNEINREQLLNNVEEYLKNS